MLKTKTKSIAFTLALGALTVAPSYAQTIDTLVTSQRAKMIEESNKKNNPLAVISGQGSAPIQLQAPQVTPALMRLPDLPGMSAGVDGAQEKPVVKPVMKAVFDITNTKYVAVYGVSGNLTAEITYNGYLARVVRNSELIDGWIVKHIDEKKVVVEKNDPKLGPQTHSLIFNIGDAVIKTVAVPPKKIPVKKRPKNVEAPATVEQMSSTTPPASKEVPASLTHTVPSTVAPAPAVAAAKSAAVK